MLFPEVAAGVVSEVFTGSEGVIEFWRTRIITKYWGEPVAGVNRIVLGPGKGNCIGIDGNGVVVGSKYQIFLPENHKGSDL